MKASFSGNISDVRGVCVFTNPAGAAAATVSAARNGQITEREPLIRF